MQISGDAEKIINKLKDNNPDKGYSANTNLTGLELKSLSFKSRSNPNILILINEVCSDNYNSKSSCTLFFHYSKTESYANGQIGPIVHFIK